jgi:hypothetical protein
MIATTASANVDMTQYNGRVLDVNANGFTGVTAPLTFNKHADGSYTFSTKITFLGEPSDAVRGRVVDRHFTFTRIRPKFFVQKYDGWIFENEPFTSDMAGKFSHNGVEQYGWYENLKVPII